MESGIFIAPPYLSKPSSKRRSSRRNRPTIRPATLFTPQDATLSPEIHFPLQIVLAPGRPAYPRFVNRFDSREMLLVVDGSCIKQRPTRLPARTSPGRGLLPVQGDTELRHLHHRR